MKKLACFLGVLVLLGSCQQMKKMKKAAEPQTTQPAAVTTDAAGGMVIATINGQPVTDEDVRKQAGIRFAQAEAALYDIRKETADQIIADKLLETAAKQQNTTKDDLLKKEVFDKIKIADADVQKFYNEKKDRFGDKKFDDVKGNIRGFLFSEQHQKIYDEFVGKLKKSNDVTFAIKAPVIDVPEGDAPAMGPKDAKVKVIEFSDYQCPFCGRARATVNRINQEYKGKVRYVFRDFPLSFHQFAQKAHEAAHCAGDQNKYWEMNKLLFEDQKDLAVDTLKKYAKDIKLNTKKFDECLASNKFQDKVKKSTEEGSALGVSGTPAYFINGRMISGARPFESFQEIIEEELKKN